MILPRTAIDDLGQTATATTTFVEYDIVLGVRSPAPHRPVADIEIISEQLLPIKIGDAPSRLRFDHSVAWRKSVLKGGRGNPLISTETTPGGTNVKRHQDGKSGRAAGLSTASLPRTVLSSATASESPTALVVKREMESWRLLQLEPSHLREPADYYAPEELDPSGRYLPALLHRLDRSDLPDEPGATLASLANRLSELVRETRAIGIDRDDARQQTTLHLSDMSGGRYPARALSDGTLRFLALLALDLDPAASSLLCLEEPENGIHPERIPRILSLLEQMPTDTSEEVGEANPLRQVIINTHSPLVVGGTGVDDLIVVRLRRYPRSGSHPKLPQFLGCEGSWRARAGAETVSKREVSRYIGAEPHDDTASRARVTVGERYRTGDLFVDAA